MTIKNRGTNNFFQINDRALSHKAKIVVHGNNNLIRVGPKTKLGKSSVDIDGNNNIVEIGSDCAANIVLKFRTDNACFRMGEKTTAIDARFYFHEHYHIEIGKDCMLSAGIVMSVSDMHNIMDLDTGLRINEGKDIVIGDHVWIGFLVQVMKGARIGRGSIIGTSAIVTKTIPEYCIAAGNPAKVIRKNVFWERRLSPSVDSKTARYPALQLQASWEGELDFAR